MIYKTSQKDYLKSFFWLVAIIICGGFLFYISLETRHAEEQLHRLSNAINQEQNHIKMLEIEMGYLTRPDRLESLAQDYLKMKAPNHEQYIAFNEIDNRVEPINEDNIIAPEALILAMKPPVPGKRPAPKTILAQNNTSDKKGFGSLLKNIHTIAFSANKE